MDRPLCQLCGKKHFLVESHIFDKENGSSIVIESFDKKDAIKSLEIPDKKAKFDRVTYQRDYMRKRRAAKKGIGKRG